MLVASGKLSIGNGVMRSTFFFGRELYAHVVERSGLVFDSRFTPELAAPSRSFVVTLAPAGDLCVRSGEADELRPVEGFIAPETSLEGPRGTRSAVMRSTGAPFIGIDIRAREDALVAPLSAPLVPLALDPELRACAMDLARATLEEGSGRLDALLRVLERRGVLHARDRGAIPTRPRRLWPAVQSLIESFSMLPSLDELSVASGLSLRQLARDVDALTDSIGLDGGWRALTRRLRLKLAVLCLSAEGATVAQVAKVAGYSSHDAMGRAFRDAGLPAPSDVRAALLPSV